MRIYLISGDGAGAGKSTFANMLVGETGVWSLARPIREDLARAYPGYPWLSKAQPDKDQVVKETGLSIRAMLITEGQSKCAADPLHYARRLADKIEASRHILTGPIAVDDLRKLIELRHLRMRFPGGTIVHFHVASPDARSEPQYDNDALSKVADYTVSWGCHESL